MYNILITLRKLAYRFITYVEHCEEKLCYKEVVKIAKTVDFPIKIYSEILYWEGRDPYINIKCNSEEQVYDLYDLFKETVEKYGFTLLVTSIFNFNSSELCLLDITLKFK